MAKSSVSQWDTTAGNNTDVGGINIDEGMAGGDVNNAVREMMAQIKAFSTTVVPAGTVQAYAGATAPPGWLLLNGQRIGSANSTADHKSDDYQALFELLWNSMSDSEAPVVEGRGIDSATEGWNSNKKITLPNATGRAIFGKENVASRLTTNGSGINGGLLGATGGDEKTPAHSHGLSASGTASPTANSNSRNIGGSGEEVPTGSHTHGVNVTGNTNSTTESNSWGNVPPAIVLNWIIKT